MLVPRPCRHKKRILNPVVGRAEAEVSDVQVNTVQEFVDAFQIIQGLLQYLSHF